MRTTRNLAVLKPRDAENEIRRVVYGLKSDLQRERELRLEGLVRALVVALHTDCHWSKAKWR